MNKLSLRKQLDIFSESWIELNSILDDYAKSVGLSYTSFEILEIVFLTQGSCTQKNICEQTFLPKQTVNTIIKTFLNDGIVELKEMGKDRRNKVISFTDSGQKYAEKIMLKMKNCKLEAFEKMDIDQRIIFVENFKQFKDNLRKSLNEK